MPALDVDFVRAQFPALATSWALMDNAGGSVPARPVIDAVHHYMRECMVQTGASYPLSIEATARVDAGHRAAASLLGCDPDEVVLGHSTTVNAQLLARAVGAKWGPGDAVVVTDLDHESNLHPWRELAARGVELRTWSFDRSSHRLELRDLEPLLDDAVRLVCFTHCSNVVGAIHDVERIAAAVHDAGAQVCVDGVAYAPHRRVDVRRLGVDYYFVSLYKVYGPHVGCMFGRRALLLDAPGQYNACVPETAIPYKFEPGNPTHELAAGVPGILAYFDAIHAHHFSDEVDTATRIDRVFDLFAAHEARLIEPLIAFLREHPKVALLGPPTADPALRVPTVAFSVEDRDASSVLTSLERAEVALRCGHFHAPAPIKRLGLLDRGGVIRVSLVHYNRAEEVSRLLDALDDALRSTS